MLICALRSVNFTWAQAQVCPGVASLVPRPPPFFVLRFSFSIILYSFSFHSYTELKPKNKNVKFTDLRAQINTVHLLLYLVSHDTM